jgi:UDP-glucose 4-epimerase
LTLPEPATIVGIVMTVLVTGGAGFIGSHVAESLIGLGHRVVALDDLSGGDTRNVPASATFVRGDVCDAALVDRLFAEHRFEVVYHLAAYAAEGLSHFIRRFNYTNNLLGSVTLVNAAVNAGTRRFVFTSSIAVYGANQLPMTEDLTPRPEDPYGIAKLAVEQDLAAAARMFDLEYVVFRPHNVYGERQNIADPYRNVVGIFMKCLLEGHPLPIFDDGRQTRAFSYIADVAPIIARAGFEPAARNEIFNVGADMPVSVIDLAHAVCRVFDRPAHIQFLPARHEVKHAFSSHKKVARAFGSAPPTALEDGLARMAAWVKQSGPGRSQRFEGIEIERNLPPSWAALAR